LPALLRIGDRCRIDARTGLELPEGLAGVLVKRKEFARERMPKVFRLCNNDIPDRERIEACLRRESRYLSPACHSIMTSGRRAVHRERRHRQH